ncbi:MAG: glycosyltransferase family 4 protein [Chloroflexota bacterium]|nr:glycosyltransferase family 4 protein [Chloroflexota bacterium]
MSKILLIGYHPPQLLKQAKIEAAHYRTWQFLQPLLDDGHTVLLCSGVRGEAAELLPVPAAWANHLTHCPIIFGQNGWISQLQAAHDSFKPDCTIAVNFSHCLYATRLRTNSPLWMDVYGDMLTIMQAANYRAGSDRGLPTSIAFMRQVLQRGDAFSVCGKPQQHALVGELAMAGRLNRHTFGFEFAHVVLPGSPPSLERPDFRATARTLLNQQGIQTDDFVVLWCGGYNTWTDVDTLFRALVWAMSQDRRIHYVSVGANTYAAPDNVYTRLLGLIEGTQQRSRFHMLGWRPWSEMKGYYQDSDVGINIDALHYETIYGTRTRLVEMIAAGLPVVTSTGAELSYLLQEGGAALTFAVGDWQGLGQHLVKLAQNRPLRDRLAQTAYSYATNQLSFATTTAALRTWVRAPKHAPDKQRHGLPSHLRAIEYGMRAFVRQGLWRAIGADK